MMIFSQSFEGDKASIELVLQIVLEKPDLKVLDVRTQVFVENLLNRSVRLDISHRLPSARFYDKIIVLKKGYIIASGTHSELFAKENGAYHELYQMRAQFYED